MKYLMNQLWREPNHEPIGWLMIFVGTVSIGALTVFFIGMIGVGYYLLPLISAGLGMAVAGLADMLPRHQRRVAGILRVTGLLCGFITFVGMVLIVASTAAQ